MSDRYAHRDVRAGQTHVDLATLTSVTGLGQKVPQTGPRAGVKLLLGDTPWQWSCFGAQQGVCRVVALHDALGGGVHHKHRIRGDLEQEPVA
jgi:hypothetical protein